MIKLTDIITEAGKENRINSMRLVALLEKLVPTLKEAQLKEVMKLTAELIAGITQVNEMPYNYNTMTEWHMTELATVVLPAKELREKLNSLLNKPTKGLDTQSVQMVLNAIDELYIY
jgi:hypothetical protein